MATDREQIAQATGWQRFGWSLSALGRVRRRLAQTMTASDAAQAVADLAACLPVLDRAEESSPDEVAALRPLVLERLVELALAAGDPAAAATHLAGLDAIVAPRRTELRWRLLTVLGAERQHEPFLEQATRYVADPGAEAENVAHLLRWYVDTDDRAGARAVAAATPPTHTVPAIQTLRMLCLAPDQIADATEAARIAAGTRPDSLGAWVSVRTRAHLLLARCAEAAGRPQDMMRAASAARHTADTQEARYWFVRSLLQLGDGARARALLADRPADAPGEWHRLGHLANLAAQPVLDLVEPCVRVLRGEWGAVAGAERDLAVRILTGAVRSDLGDERERISVVAELSEQIEQCVGALPWFEYNRALGELVIDGAFQAAARRLARSVQDTVEWAAPGRYPVPLLRAACATVLGRDEALRGALREARVLPAGFERDVRFFGAVSGVLDLLRTGGDAPADLAAGLGALPDRLATALPVLADVGALGDQLVRARHGRAVAQVPAEHLPACDWAHWLRERIALGAADGDEAAAQDELADAADPLAWDRRGWLQDVCHASPDFAAFRAGGEPESRWSRMAAVRRDLTHFGAPVADRPPDDGAAARPDAACPWWPEDHPLQPTFRHQAQVEWRYLEGRRALRGGLAAEALRWFRAARDADAAGLPGWLVARRFADVVRYWEGVALAHGGEFAEAVETLRTCLAGPKAGDAHAQLGLIAVAQGDHETARAHLAEAAPGTGGAARHLAGLLDGDPGTEPGAEAGQVADGALYAAAALRRAGAERERQGDAAGAAAAYREALARWPGDPVAGARLARIWLREVFEHLGRDQPHAAEPALAGFWDNPATPSWASGLPRLQRLLVGEPGSDAAAARLEGDPGPASAAWALLELRRLVTGGRPDTAAQHAEQWSDGHDGGPLRVAALTLAAARETGALLRGEADPARRRAAADLLGGLEALAEDAQGDRRLAFWRRLLAFALDPSATRVDELAAASTGDTGDTAAHDRRALVAFAGLFSTDTERRTLAAAQWAKPDTLDATAPVGEVAEVARCLAAHAAGNDAEFVRRFADLHHDPGALPCELAELYVAASESCLRTGAVDVVTEGDIPEQLADLADPDVRRVIGLAYAHRAARAAALDPRAALDDVVQAIELMQ